MVAGLAINAQQGKTSGEGQPEAERDPAPLPPCHPGCGEPRFRCIVEATPLGLHLYTLADDDHLVFTGANAASNRILGVDHTRFLGLGLEEAFPPFAESELAHRFLELARSGGSWSTTEFAYAHDGIEGTFEVYAFQLAPGELAALFRDVSDERRNTASLERYRGQLEELVQQLTREFRLAQEELARRERLAALGQLTATVAHELRNPLGVLRAGVFSLRHALDRGDGQRVDRTLTLVERAITRVDHIITELLDYTRQREAQRQALDLDAWLEALLDEQAPVADVTSLRSFGFGRTAWLDPFLLRSAVVNLLENACHAVCSLEAGERWVRVSTAAVDDHVEIRVEDNGPGIPEEHRQRVFEPLFSTKSFGVGLGLPIVKRVADLHGGTVEIALDGPRGTIVRLRLPAEPPRETPR